MQNVLHDRDTFALLPTGGGKSLCFQIPALAREGLCLVVTPLIALMKDQVESLSKKGIKAAAVYSGMSKKEIDNKLELCARGDYKFLYVSPERLQTDLFRERLKRFPVNLLAIDEAHCISEWGYDFRPSYLKIAEIRQFIPDVPVLALTATATVNVKKDITEKLALKKPAIFQTSFRRENLVFGTAITESKEEKLVQILNNVPGTGIIYLRSRAGTEKLSNFLNKKGFKSTWYHAGLDGKEREKRQQLWQNDKVKLMVATNAFGMGIDKAEVRKVVHMDLPDSPEAYFQEAGRGGRDGKKAYAVVVAHHVDKEELRKGVDVKFPDFETIKEVYHAVCNYLQIPIGSGAGENFDFDLRHFSHKYNQQALIAYNCLKVLEQEEYITLLENTELPARMMFTINYRDLYEFQIENKKFEPLIKVILRTYPGIQEEYTRISEKEIAEKAGIAEDQCKELLQTLKKQDILDYQPSRNKPQIFLQTNRLDKSQLNLDYKRLRQRREIYREKVEAFINYCFADDKCRTRILLDYFGEELNEDCGHCDYCIRKRKSSEKPDKAQKIKSHILNLLKNESIHHNDVVSQLQKDFRDEELILQALRELLDEEKISLDEDQKLKANGG